MKNILLIISIITVSATVNPTFSQPDLSIGILNRGYASYDQNTGEITGAFFDVVNTGSAFTTSFKIRLYVIDSIFNSYDVATITDGNGQTGASATTHTININLNNNPNIPAGKYTLSACADSDSVIVESTENNNCYFVSPNLNDLIYTPNTVSLKGIAKASNKTLTYPNPASENIVFEQNKINNETLTIYNVTGKLSKTIVLNKLKTKVDITDLNKGLYLYSTMNNEGNITSKGKFVKN
jgi:hypothetical protein